MQVGWPLLVTLSVYAMVAVVFGQEGGGYYDDFSRLNSSHWGMSGPGLLRTGAPVMQLPDQCKFHVPLGNKTGLLMTMSNTPCLASPSKCCASHGRTCSTLATCHLGSFQSYLYGTFEASIRFAHLKDGSRDPNALSFFSIGYTDSPVHNEITIGFDGNEPDHKIHLAYWYNATMNRKEVLVPFDPWNSFNTYTVEWTPSKIVWKANDKVLAIDTGIAGKTIPYLPLSTRIILRPHREIKNEDVFIEYEYYKYVPMKK